MPIKRVATQGNEIVRGPDRERENRVKDETSKKTNGMGHEEREAEGRSCSVVTARSSDFPAKKKKGEGFPKEPQEEGSLFRQHARRQ